MGILGIIGSLAGGLFASKSADKATNAQLQATEKQIDFAQGIADQQTENFAPFLGAGQNALAAYNYEIGVGPRPTFGATPLSVTEFTDTMGGGSRVENDAEIAARRRAFNANFANADGDDKDQYRPWKFDATPQNINAAGQEVTRYRVGGEVFDDRAAADAYAAKNGDPGQEYGGYQKSPGYDFGLQQGLDAIESSAAARGGLNSGATMQANQKFGKDYATADYNTYVNRLAQMAGAGQAAAGNQAAVLGNLGTTVNSAYGAQGNALAAGAIAQGNAWTGAINNITSSLTAGQNTQGTPFFPQNRMATGNGALY